MQSNTMNDEQDPIEGQMKSNAITRTMYCSDKYHSMPWQSKPKQQQEQGTAMTIHAMTK